MMPPGRFVPPTLVRPARHTAARAPFSHGRVGTHERRVLRGARAHAAPVPPSTGRRSVAPVRWRPGPSPCSSTDGSRSPRESRRRDVAAHATGSEGDLITTIGQYAGAAVGVVALAYAAGAQSSGGDADDDSGSSGAPSPRARASPRPPPASRPSPAASPAPTTPTSARSPSRACPSAPIPRPRIHPPGRIPERSSSKPAASRT